MLVRQYLLWTNMMFVKHWQSSWQQDSNEAQCTVSQILTLLHSTVSRILTLLHSTVSHILTLLHSTVSQILTLQHCDTCGMEQGQNMWHCGMDESLRPWKPENIDCHLGSTSPYTLSVLATDLSMIPMLPNTLTSVCYDSYADSNTTMSPCLMEMNLIIHTQDSYDVPHVKLKLHFKVNIGPDRALPSGVEIRRTCRTIGHFLWMSDKKCWSAGPNVRQKLYKKYPFDGWKEAELEWPYRTTIRFHVSHCFCRHS